MGKEKTARLMRRLAAAVHRELDADGTNTRIARAFEIFSSGIVQTILRTEFEKVDMRTDDGARLLVRRVRELVGSKIDLTGIDVAAQRGAGGIQVRIVPTRETFAAARARVAHAVRVTRA